MFTWDPNGENLFTLVFIAGKMKWKSVSGVVVVERPIKNLNKPESDIEASMLEAIIWAFIEDRPWDYPENFVIFNSIEKVKPSFLLSSMCIFLESNGKKSESHSFHL